jgi:hypothetical protein
VAVQIKYFKDLQSAFLDFGFLFEESVTAAQRVDWTVLQMKVERSSDIIVNRQ